MKQQKKLNRTTFIGVNQANHTKAARAKFISITCVSILLLSFSSVALSGCGPSSIAPDSAEAPDRVPPSSETQPTEPAPNNPEIPLPSETLEGDPDTGVTPFDSAQLPPDVETSVLQDIASNNNVPLANLEVEAAVPQAWPDGCLGLGGPDEICTFAVVEGWEVTVSQGDNIWVYRTDSEGFVVREDTTES